MLTMKWFWFVSNWDRKQRISVLFFFLCFVIISVLALGCSGGLTDATSEVWMKSVMRTDSRGREQTHESPPVSRVLWGQQNRKRKTTKTTQMICVPWEKQTQQQQQQQQKSGRQEEKKWIFNDFRLFFKNLKQLSFPLSTMSSFSFQFYE